MVNRIERVNRPARRGRTAILIGAALAVTGLATYASIPAADGVIHGCYKRASGALRVIDDTSGRCDANELPLTWSQSGLPGSPGPPGPPGPQGAQRPPGSAGSRLLATAAGAGFTSVPCTNDNQAGPVHSVSFDKESEDSRLRISYADVAYFLLTENELPRVEVRIDGNAITPTPLIVRFLPQDDSAPISSWEYAKQFTTFGYADDVAAGSHTLTVIYTFPSFANIRACYRGYPDVIGAPFQIEIEEIP